VIPLLTVGGSHRETGAQLGETLQEQIRRAAEAQKRLALAAECREITVRHLPWIVEELDAAAKAADVDPLRLFAAMIEEIQAEQPATVGRCTDLVTRGDNGQILVAHNNDYTAETRDDVVAIEWHVEGQPRMFTLGIGPWLSVGWNETGLSVTGNELTPNDERVGIPRLLQIRAVVACRTLDDAVQTVLHPARASSYNWVLSSPEGAVNVEGSATAAVRRTLGPGSSLVHTNHYVEPAMVRFEGDPDYAVRSAIRCARARELAEDARPPTVERLRAILSDHEHSPDSLCRHTGDTQTIFWCIADVSAGVITYGLGNPCDSETQEYAFR
jgi:isopenicillin-N N-acyltransferase-like protein